MSDDERLNQVGDALRGDWLLKVHARDFTNPRLGGWQNIL
ncbi:MAG: hypothetical protein CM15mP120_21900 [Pseudomonadota bacterium]|nr:MAG: hypothetical protein CM15mP120_21900 [Pseudomonadota bacterium]